MLRFAALSAAATCLLAVVSASPINCARQESCVHSDITRNCWSEGFDILTNHDDKWPETGNTVRYNLEITNSVFAPDGVQKEGFLINGQYPGPLIEANWGDTICATVKNSLQNNGTAIHWHGIRQLNTNIQDGTAGVTECPIAPGHSKEYCWKATQYGTSWYHSHLPSQYAQGIVGPIIIHGPTSFNYDVDLGVLPLTDWFYESFFQVQARASHAAGPPTADTILINGSMTSASGGQYSKVTLEPGKKHLLRFVNTGINNYFHVSLDNHQFTVVSADFVPILPYKTDSIVLGVGQRYDVIVESNQTPGSYWLRVGSGGTCDGPLANAQALAIFNYAGTPEVTPTSTGTLPTGCYDEVVTPIQSASVPAGTLNPEISLDFIAAQGEAPVFWTINSHALKIDWETPTLTQIAAGNTTWAVDENVQTVGSESGWSYWVVRQNPDILVSIPHPVHLHGHDFFILAQGVGDYTTATLNYNNPIRRDTATLEADGYLILAFKTDNPGAWLMHCHIPFHAEGGLGLQFIERADEISSHMDLGVLNEQCQNWQTWWAANGNGVTGSGI